MRFPVMMALGLGACRGIETETDLNPISRVVGLMQGLVKSLEADSEKEEGMYEKFVCWGKTTISEKEASNKDANARIEELKTYIADIEAGKIEFTSERADLEKELEAVTKELDDATTEREKEKADFDKAETELKQAVAALQEAVKLLKEATDVKEGAKAGLLAFKSELNAGSGFAARAAEAALLSHAADLGEKVLSHADAQFLRHLITGEIPHVDPVRMQKKATFKMSYSARSGTIQKLLANMLKTFERRLNDAVAAEKKAGKEFDDLDKAKSEQKKSIEEALSKTEVEKGARRQTAAEASSEIDLLELQVKEDEKFIKQTEDVMSERAKEWQARKDLRTGEIAAFSKAISVLHSDDARVLMRKSHKSQGYGFLQLQDKRRSLAASELQRAAVATSDARVAVLASKLARAQNEAITKVVGAIDKMVETLKKEEKEELELKEKCESSRSSEYRDAAVESRTIDDKTDDIDVMHGEIKDIEKEIAKLNDEIKKIEEEIKQADQNRGDERRAFEAARADDEAAHDLVVKATGIIEDFYKNNGLSLVESGKSMQPVQAGKAPPPPPKPWEKAEYGGAKGESNGVISILKMVAEDINKDIKKGDDIEDQAIEAFADLKESLNSQISGLEDLISDEEGHIAEKEKKIEGVEKEREGMRDDLRSMVKRLKDMEPGCDYIAVNFDIRTNNRQIEIDGLVKAKAILQGADFSLIQRHA